MRDQDDQIEEVCGQLWAVVIPAAVLVVIVVAVALLVGAVAVGIVGLVWIFRHAL